MILEIHPPDASDGLHPQVKAFLDTVAEAGAPPIGKGTPEVARAGNAELLRMVGRPGPEVRTVSDFEVAGGASPLQARAYVPHSGGAAGVIVYLHGGGWVTGDLEAHDGLCRHLAVLADCDVVNVNYRHAPEDPFPAAVDDAYAAALWIEEHIADGRPLIVAGDSAGGNLAAATALRARDTGAPAIALQVLLYPVLDHDFATPSYTRLREGYLLGRAEMEWFWHQYAPDVVDRDNPYASPLRTASVDGVAPAIILLPEFDPLFDEGLAYAERLSAAGVPVVASMWKGMTHGFISFPAVFDTADAAVLWTGDAISSALRTIPALDAT